MTIRTWSPISRVSESFRFFTSTEHHSRWHAGTTPSCSAHLHDGIFVLARSTPIVLFLRRRIRHRHPRSGCRPGHYFSSQLLLSCCLDCCVEEPPSTAPSTSFPSCLPFKLSYHGAPRPRTSDRQGRRGHCQVSYVVAVRYVACSFLSRPCERYKRSSGHLCGQRLHSHVKASLPVRSRSRRSPVLYCQPPSKTRVVFRAPNRGRLSLRLVVLIKNKEATGLSL